MMRANRITTGIGAVVMAATLVACSDRAEREAADAANKTANAADKAGNTAAEAGRDAAGAAKDAGGAVADAVRQGGRAADAAVQTMDVKVALTADKRVDASNINVDSDHVTRTVTLKGRVPTADQKKWAEEIAVAKGNGYRVRNELVVGR
jgi:osmotically-inducible protein OsmY